jgi:hypothetical protein
MTKYYWTVNFADGKQERINSARGWKDAHNQAVRRHGSNDAIDVRRHDVNNSNIKVWAFNNTQSHV